MSGRDPFPSPKAENDFTLGGFRPQKRKTHDKPTHIAQMEEPWRRLYYTATVSSTRRSVMHHELQASKDSLDFLLESVYDHHKDTFWTKNEIFYQRETVYHNQMKQERIKEEMLKKEQENDIRVWVDPQRCSIYSIK
ncbi:cilia- and flagella-associated protein 276 [Symphorus nematophorus]